MNRWLVLSAAAFVRMAFAQGNGTAWLIELSSNEVNPSNPSVTVRIDARFPTSDAAWAAGKWDVLAGDGVWSDLTRLLSQSVSPSLGTTIQGGDVLDIWMGQLNLQPQYADPANPIRVWQATWTATNFAPRTVHVTTHTRTFFTYLDRNSPEAVSRLSLLREGSAVIRVVPAPATLLIAGFLSAARRRR